jgi:phosphoglycolate phosphatase-like HAD superfamily hydrolase
MPPVRLVLFDIDGTLLWPDGAGRASMKIALREVYGTAGAIDCYQFAGHTDRETVARLMGEAGIPSEVIWERFDLLAPAITAALVHLVQEKRHNIRLPL